MRIPPPPPTIFHGISNHTNWLSSPIFSPLHTCISLTVTRLLCMRGVTEGVFAWHVWSTLATHCLSSLVYETHWMDTQAAQREAWAWTVLAELQVLRCVCTDFLHVSKSPWRGWCYTASLPPVSCSHSTLVAQSRDLKLSSCGLGVTIGSKGISGYKQGCDIPWAWGINSVDGQWDRA